MGVAMLSACASRSVTKPTTEAKTPVVLTEADNGATRTMKVGTSFDLRLKANATTGYSWALEKLPGTIVASRGEPEYIQYTHPEGMVGVGGTAVFHFMVQSAGKTTIKLNYARPWEKVAPAQTFVVTIDAQK